MGLIDGKWVDQWYDTKSTGGRFQRMDASFRNWIEPNGAFAPEPGRYHLYVPMPAPGHIAH